MKVSYSIAILIGCIAIHFADAFTSDTTLVKQRRQHQRYDIIGSTFQGKRVQLLRQKVLATSITTPAKTELDIHTILQEMTERTESFFLLIPTTYPEKLLPTRVIDLVLSILKNTRERMLEHPQCNDPFLDALLKRLRQQTDTNISDLLAERNRILARTPFLSKRRVSSQREDGEEGDEQHHKGSSRQGDNEEGDSHHRHEKDNQESDDHRRGKSKQDEEGGQEDGREGDDTHRAHDTAKMKRQVSSFFLVKEMDRALDQMSDCISLMPHQDNLFIHLNLFLSLVYQAIKECDSS